MSRARASRRRGSRSAVPCVPCGARHIGSPVPGVPGRHRAVGRSRTGGPPRTVRECRRDLLPACNECVRSIHTMADLFEDYRLGPGWDEMFGEPGMPRETLRGAARHAAAAVQRRAGRPGRGAGPGLPRPGHHVRAQGRRAAVPARHRAADHRRRRVAVGRGRRRAAGPGAGGVPRRRLRRRPGARRRRRAAPDHRDQRPLPPRGGRASTRPTAYASTSPAST